MPTKTAAAVLALIIGLVSLIIQTPKNTDVHKEATDVTPVHYGEVMTLTAEYPHDETSFTQGLFFFEGGMYESTGRYGESAMYADIELATGKPNRKLRFDDAIFAEGSVVFKDSIYVLTYKENKVLVLNSETLELENTFSYSRQGWGLTTDGEYLIASDGSSSLFFMDERLNDVRSVEVTYNGEPMKNINELEYIDGLIYANIWLTDSVAVIEPQTGVVTALIDFSGLYEQKSTDINDVLNGIAYNAETRKVYFTGKRWSKLFEFEFKNQS